MELGDGERPLTTLDDHEVAAVSAEREYVRRVMEQERRIEATWRWSHRVDCGSVARAAEHEHELSCIG